MYKKAILYWHTVKYLKISQVIYQIIQRTPFRRTKVPLDINKEIRPLTNRWVKPPRRSKGMLSYGEFKFLNEIFRIEKSKDWNSITRKKLWLYNLHYFNDLISNNSDEENKSYEKLINLWVTHNPPFFGIGWDPYPTSIRIVNLVKWLIEGNDLSTKSLSSLALQARYLRKNLELHILGNHLFANAKALIYAGLFFSSKESDEWYSKGILIFENELREQVLEDGGTFELSPMYHSIILEDILDVINIHKAFNRRIEINLEEIIIRMITWLRGMCHPDREISFFNDSCFGVATKLDDLIIYACELFPEKSSILHEESIPGLIDFSQSGYSRISNDHAVLLVDRGEIGASYIPGHAHADTLSFEMSLFQKRLIVNSGISTYEKSEQRHSQRSTISHSTVAVDQISSSEIWDSFRVGRRANVIDKKNIITDQSISISGAHNGYSKLDGKPIHSREWVLEENKLVIYDRITGKGRHLVEIIFILHPLINIVSIEKNNLEIDIDGNSIGIQFNDIGKLDIQDSFYFPEFGLSKKNKKLIYSCNENLPIHSETQIIWNQNK